MVVNALILNGERVVEGGPVICMSSTQSKASESRSAAGHTPYMPKTKAKVCVRTRPKGLARKVAQPPVLDPNPPHQPSHEAAVYGHL